MQEIFLWADFMMFVIKTSNLAMFTSKYSEGNSQTDKNSAFEIYVHFNSLASSLKCHYDMLEYML